MTTNGEQLHQVLAEWRRLTVAEGRAIREGNWEFVSECQRALSELRPKIEGLTGRTTQEVTSPPTEPPTRKISSRATVLELIELQRKNLQSVEQRRQKLSSHIEGLSRAGRNLRGLQRSYAGPAKASWSSYS
jgi:hypothetical protein